MRRISSNILPSLVILFIWTLGRRSDTALIRITKVDEYFCIKENQDDSS